MYDIELKRVVDRLLRIRESERWSLDYGLLVIVCFFIIFKVMDLIFNIRNVKTNDIYWNDVYIKNGKKINIRLLYD